jgi:hypothetical protein
LNDLTARLKRLLKKAVVPEEVRGFPQRGRVSK